jgi:hypothetical protein
MSKQVPKIIIAAGVVLVLYELGTRPAVFPGSFWVGADCSSGTCVPLCKTDACAFGHNSLLIAWIGIIVAGVVFHKKMKNRVPRGRQEHKNA